ncbi:MAG: zinc-binding dehydrogenase [Chloroflexaceae bacterium]
MELPSTYKKLIAARIGKDFRNVVEIVDTPMTQPGPDEVLIKNSFAGVNAVDLNLVANAYNISPPVPFDLGLEAIGTVAAAGSNVTHLPVGAPVITFMVGAAYREYVVMPAMAVIPIPTLSTKILPLLLSGTTASMALELVGEMTREEVVLVTAAAGGTGQFAVQLAKLAGNHVIGTCGSPAKAAQLRELGCDRVVNYREESLDQVLSEEYPDGVNLVYESVGRSMFDTALKHLALRGRLVVIGHISEYQTQVEQVTAPRVYTSLVAKSASIRGFAITHFPPTCIPEHFARLVHYWQQGQLRSLVDPKEFQGVAAIPDAIDYLFSQQSRGKVVVTF